LLSKLAKLLLVATSLAPVLGAFAMVRISEGKSGWSVYQWFFYAAMLLAICVLVTRFAKSNVEKEVLNIKTVRNSDKEILAFLIAYLLPLVTHDSLGIKSVATTTYVFAIIAWAVYHCNSYYFNPLLGLLGYHFYEIETVDGMPHMLLTKQTIKTPSTTIQAVHLFDYTYLDVGGRK